MDLPKNQETVKIDREMSSEISKFIKTEKGKKLGFNSKAEFINQASRELLIKYTYIEKKKLEGGK